LDNEGDFFFLSFNTAAKRKNLKRRMKMCSVKFACDVPEETRNLIPFKEVNTKAKNGLKGCIIYIFTMRCE
jgi:hypothetical protein